MRLELKDIKGGVLEQDYSCTLNDFPDLTELMEQGGPQFEEPIVFHLRLQRTGQMVEVDGQLSATLQLSCGRCLKRFKQKIADSFALTFSPLIEETSSDDEIELEAEELGLIVYHDDILDLREPLQEQLVMSIPISPVCDAGCLGLCHECGADLNSVQCGCRKKLFNNKFSVLADIALDK